MPAAAKDRLHGTLDALISRPCRGAPAWLCRDPVAPRYQRGMPSRSRKAPSIQRCTAWSGRGGSRRNGARRSWAGRRGSTGSRPRGGSSSWPRPSGSRSSWRRCLPSSCRADAVPAVRGLGRQLRSRIWRDSVAEQVDAELDFHLEMLTRELTEAGRSPEDARAEALRRFGDLAAVSASCRKIGLERERSERRTEYLAELRQDAAHAVRQLRRAPAFTAVALLTLVLADRHQHRDLQRGERGAAPAAAVSRRRPPHGPVGLPGRREAGHVLLPRPAGDAGAEPDVRRHRGRPLPRA